MLESLFYFSTRDRLLVCRRNSKVIKNILKPGNRMWGSGLNRKILAPSSFCPVGAPVFILFIYLLTHAVMLIWHYIFIWWVVFWQEWSTNVHSISSSSKNWPIASLVLVILPLVINGSLPAAWCQMVKSISLHWSPILRSYYLMCEADVGQLAPGLGAEGSYPQDLLSPSFGEMD